jgi:hypothetical protein
MTGLTSISLGDDYSDWVAKRLPLVGTDGPYAYITKEDAKNDSHSGRKSGVETDAAFGLSKIRMGGVVSDLWTATSLHRSQILRDL